MGAKPMSSSWSSRFRVWRFRPGTLLFAFVPIAVAACLVRPFVVIFGEGFQDLPWFAQSLTFAYLAALVGVVAAVGYAWLRPKADPKRP